MSFYITTPIYYVNGKPHIGHAYTTVIADVIARWNRLLGEDVQLQTGVDEHGQKVLEKAQERGMDPQAHCDDMVVHWKQMVEDLRIGEHTFARTTAPVHTQFVRVVLDELYRDGLIYKKDYAGWYSTAAERFWTEKDLEDGKCPDTGQPVQWVEEPNYFFRMSQFHAQLAQHIEDHPEYIQPTTRRNEMLGYLKQPLGDLCISRPKSRMGWGIELPFDEDYVTYVWFDALLNYLSFDLRNERADVHLVGKDILTTHAVYWSTMLMALELPLAKTIYAHGWWMSDANEKMSKSAGNAIDVDLLTQCYGVDAVRFFMVRAVELGKDGKFSYQRFHDLYNTDLANLFGNLAHRTLTMFDRWVGEFPTPCYCHITEITQAAIDAKQAHYTHMKALQPYQAVEDVVALMDKLNKYIDDMKPWALNKAGETQKLEAVLVSLVNALYDAADLLQSVMPDKCEDLMARIGARTPGERLTVGEPLFPRHRELPPEIAALLEI